jgi:hypothetical protein
MSKTRLSPAQLRYAIQAWELLNHSTYDIARYLHVPEAAVANSLAQWREQGRVINQPALSSTALRQ